MFLHRKYYAVHFIFYVVMLALFGFKGLLAYAIVPTGLGFIAVNMQNYFAHGKTIGYANFETHDYSKNVPFMFFFTFGENWHNNHHYKANSITTKVKWWEIDPVYVWCWLFNVDNHAKWKSTIKQIVS
jgi:stearoyl-CoA desaturase (delta-9 desaturase)